MDAMDLVFGKNPDRPNTPDLWRISEVLLKNDGAIDEAPDEDKRATWLSITSAVVDVDSVRFMAEQRVLRAFGPVTKNTNLQVRAALVSLAVDSFITGACFQRAGGHRESFGDA
jgi:hypothetical protein